MDGVIADFDKVINELCPELKTSDLYLDEEVRSKKIDELVINNPDFFHNLPPYDGAIEAVNILFDLFEVYFLSSPMWEVPNSFIGKRIWLETHFGERCRKKLILSHRKDLNIGHYLVDDRIKNGVSGFTGKHIHFATEEFPDWKITLEYLKNNSERKRIIPHVPIDQRELLYEGVDKSNKFSFKRFFDSFKKVEKSPIPLDAHSLEVFAIKDSQDSPSGKEAYIGFKLINDNFHFISVPFTEPIVEKNSEILPCPFCGSKVEIAYWYDLFATHQLFRIECQKGHYLDRWEDSKEEAIKEWNKRFKG